MTYLLIVEMLDCREYLFNYFRAILLGETTSLNDVLEKLPSTTKLCYQVVVLVIDIHLIELDDIRMIDAFQYFELCLKLTLH